MSVNLEERAIIIKFSALWNAVDARFRPISILLVYIDTLHQKTHTGAGNSQAVRFAQ